ncbi:30S ribosomal protein S16 [Patescibacteria group bacterium]
MLVIRYSRAGKKNQPFFKILVTEKRKPPKGGRFVEEVGSFSPQTKKKVLKADRIKYWMSVGAKPSPTVYNLLISEKVIEGKKIPMHKKAKVKEESGEVPKTEAPKTEAPVVETKEIKTETTPVIKTTTPTEVKPTEDSTKKEASVLAPEPAPKEKVSEPASAKKTPAPVEKNKKEVSPEPQKEKKKEELKKEKIPAPVAETPKTE